MNKYTCPVIYTIVGYVEIEAADLQSAKVIAKKMNEDGIAEESIQDRSDNSEVYYGECELIS